MPKHTSPYVVGDFWLDKRPDGKSPFWQITHYDAKSRQNRYRSTGTECLDTAIEAITAFHAEEKSLTLQEPEDAKVIPLLMTYWRERGSHIIASDQAGRSIRVFMAFLLQEPGAGDQTLKDLVPALFERFRLWRMGPHSFTLPWGSITTPFVSPKGVTGDTVDRNINDIRAAINHAYANQRITRQVIIKGVEKRYKNKHRDRVLTEDEMAQIFWYASHFPDLFRFVSLQMMTSVRPDAAGMFDPRKQYLRDRNLIDLQPDEKPNTKKRNAIIPAVRPLRPILNAWLRDGVKPVRSRKTAWRNLRRTLGLSDDVFPKTIRYTIATWLYEMEWVPERQISEMLGHVANTQLARTSARYAQYRPEKMGKVVKGLEQIWMQVSRDARKFDAYHLLTTVGQGGQHAVVKK